MYLTANSSFAKLLSSSTARVPNYFETLKKGDALAAAEGKRAARGPDLFWAPEQ